MWTKKVHLRILEAIFVVVIIVDFDVVVDIAIMFLIDVADHIVLSCGQSMLI